MDKNEAIIRYALQHRELDDLKVWLLNGGSIKDYFASHKQNIKLNLNQGTFSVTAKDAEKNCGKNDACRIQQARFNASVF